MFTIHFKQATTLTPEQYVAGLTDFGPGRSKVFRNCALDAEEAAATERAGVRPGKVA
jgi:hypothetical protein